MASQRAMIGSTYCDHQNCMHSLTPIHRANYRFGKTLGAGTYGIVREADGPQGKCAVKIILKKNVRGNEQMVYDEMEMLSKMHHPHIVKFYEWFESKVRHAQLFSNAISDTFDRISTTSLLSSLPAESFSIAYARRASSRKRMRQRPSDKCSMLSITCTRETLSTEARTPS